jgi:hypothetical protein
MIFSKRKRGNAVALRGEIAGNVVGAVIPAHTVAWINTHREDYMRATARFDNAVEAARRTFDAPREKPWWKVWG